MRLLTGVLLFFFILLLGASLFVAFLLFIPAVRPKAAAVVDCGPIYTVQAGDTLESVATHCGVALIDLQIFNPAVTDDNIAAGQILNIPGHNIQFEQIATDIPEPTATPAPTKKPKATVIPQTGVAKGGAAQQYIVQPGDWLNAIARRYGVTLQALIAANPQFPNPDLIYPGQIVNIPTSIPPTGGEGDYVVKAGDTMYAIAASFGVSLNSLIAANPQISNPNLIYPGQPINLPGGSGIPATGGGGPDPVNTVGSYTVQPGDTLRSIAERYGISLEALQALNPEISDPNKIVPGQVIQVP